MVSLFCARADEAVSGDCGLRDFFRDVRPDLRSGILFRRKRNDAAGIDGTGCRHALAAQLVRVLSEHDGGLDLSLCIARGSGVTDLRHLPASDGIRRDGFTSVFSASERRDRLRSGYDLGVLSFLSLFRRLSAGFPKPDWRRVTGSMFYRICQLQVCLIYGFAGLDKVKGSSWWRGDAIWMIFANTQRATVDLSWLGHFPAVLAFMTYATLFFEVYFPVIVWFRPVGRAIALGFGLLMHCGIALTMGLVSFSSLMVSTYSLFLDADTADKITQCVKKVLTHRKVFVRNSDQ